MVETAPLVVAIDERSGLGQISPSCRSYYESNKMMPSIPGRSIMPRSKRKYGEKIWSNEDWIVQPGELRPTKRNRKRDHLFQYVGEKLPWDALNAVNKYLKEQGVSRDGVYMAHDSFGVARYGGRGRIFSRLRSHKNKYYRELVYFSFYIIANKTHEHEIENVILRAAGPQMILNQRKVRDGIDPGSVGDYEPGTNFFRRKYARDAKRSVKLPRGRRKRHS
jgi:hypothetical protein